MVYGLQTATINSLSSELAEKSFQVNQQQQTIDEYTSLAAAQQEELTSKSAQLEELESEIGTLAQEIESQGRLIAEKSEQVELQEKELAQLRLRATILEQDITSLKSEVQAKDKDLANLLLENASARRVHVAYFGLGVDDKGDGVVFPMELEIIGSGDGRISVDVSDVDYQAGFQDAVRTAAVVAADYTGVPVSNKDFILRLVNDSGDVIRVDGTSAGAAITAMMVAGLTEKQLDSSALVTGTIQPNGAIGNVGGLRAKAEAAVDFGADTLLVPSGQEFFDGRIEIEGVADISELASRIITG